MEEINTTEPLFEGGTEEVGEKLELSEEETNEEAIGENGDEAEELSLLGEAIPTLLGTAELTEAVALPRYRELRALGLSPLEAYRATARPKESDTRAHLTDSYPRASVSPAAQISQRELSMAREIFSDLSDKDILRLYKKVTAR